MGYVLYEFRTSHKMDGLYFQVGRTENEGCSKFADWEDFQDEFRKEFTPAHTDSLVINHLESTTYYQKSHSLDDYIDEFQDLITDSGYTDLKMIVIKFR